MKWILFHILKDGHDKERIPNTVKSRGDQNALCCFGDFKGLRDSENEQKQSGPHQ